MRGQDKAFEIAGSGPGQRDGRRVQALEADRLSVAFSPGYASVKDEYLTRLRRLRARYAEAAVVPRCGGPGRVGHTGPEEVAAVSWPATCGIALLNARPATSPGQEALAGIAGTIRQVIRL